MRVRQACGRDSFMVLVYISFVAQGLATPEKMKRYGKK